MIPLRLLYGPFRLSVSPSGVANPRGGDEVVPAFVTLPRGLFPCAEARGPGAIAEWNRVAPALETILPSIRAGGRPFGPLAAWIEASVQAGVLTWQESAGACREFLTALAARRDLCDACGLPPADRWTAAECWQVKEGHTSSVWGLLITARGAGPTPLCVNVARDAVASRELAGTSERLRELHARDPGHVAAVHAIWQVESPAGAGALTVTVQEWVPGRELHVPAGDANGLLEIAWFLGPAPGGAGPQRVLGRRLTAEEQDRVARQALAFLERHAVWSSDGSTVEVPAIEVNEGDAVWADGRFVVVAVSETVRRLPAGEWHRVQASPQAWPSLAGTV